jgi:hypothetical protein
MKSEMLHEINHVAALTAATTIENLLHGVDAEAIVVAALGTAAPTFGLAL